VGGFRTRQTLSQRTATSPRYGRSLHTTYLCTVPGYSLDRRASSSATGERYLLRLYAGIRPKKLANLALLSFLYHVHFPINSDPVRRLRSAEVRPETPAPTLAGYLSPLLLSWPAGVRASYGWWLWHTVY